MEKMVVKDKNVFIQAKKITIGWGITFGKNISIKIKGNLRIGDRCHLGSNVKIRGNNIFFGCDLFHSTGLEIGGGGASYPQSNLTIGDRCTVHNNHINICEPVTIGNDVGLSPEVAIITHGYWLSVLEGFPAKFKGVNIKSGVIVGRSSIILMGVTIGNCSVVGAGSVVTKDLEPRSVYAGNPARFIRKIKPLNREDRILKVDQILSKYMKIAKYHGIQPVIKFKYPIITVNNCKFDVETLTFSGTEDKETDDFRDYVRKWGFRFYTDRPFKQVWSWDHA